MKSKSLGPICNAEKIASEAIGEDETFIDLFDMELVTILKKRNDLFVVDEDVKNLMSRYGARYDEIDDALFLQDLINDPDALLESERETIERRYNSIVAKIKLAADRKTDMETTQNYKKDVVRMRNKYKKVKKPR